MQISLVVIRYLLFYFVEHRNIILIWIWFYFRICNVDSLMRILQRRSIVVLNSSYVWRHLLFHRLHLGEGFTALFSGGVNLDQLGILLVYLWVPVKLRLSHIFFVGLCLDFLNLVILSWNWVAFAFYYFHQHVRPVIVILQHLIQNNRTLLTDF